MPSKKGKGKGNITQRTRTLVTNISTISSSKNNKSKKESPNDIIKTAAEDARADALAAQLTGPSRAQLKAQTKIQTVSPVAFATTKESEIYNEDTLNEISAGDAVRIISILLGDKPYHTKEFQRSNGTPHGTLAQLFDSALELYLNSKQEQPKKGDLLQKNKKNEVIYNGVTGEETSMWLHGKKERWHEMKLTSEAATHMGFLRELLNKTYKNTNITTEDKLRLQINPLAKSMSDGAQAQVDKLLSTTDDDVIFQKARRHEQQLEAKETLHILRNQFNGAYYTDDIIALSLASAEIGRLCMDYDVHYEFVCARSTSHTPSHILCEPAEVAVFFMLLQHTLNIIRTKQTFWQSGSSDSLTEFFENIPVVLKSELQHYINLLIFNWNTFIRQIGENKKGLTLENFYNILLDNSDKERIPAAKTLLTSLLTNFVNGMMTPKFDNRHLWDIIKDIAIIKFTECQETSQSARFNISKLVFYCGSDLLRVLFPRVLEADKREEFKQKYHKKVLKNACIDGGNGHDFRLDFILELLEGFKKTMKLDEPIQVRGGSRTFPNQTINTKLRQLRTLLTDQDGHKKEDKAIEEALMRNMCVTMTDVAGAGRITGEIAIEFCVDSTKNFLTGQLPQNRGDLIAHNLCCLSDKPLLIAIDFTGEQLATQYLSAGDKTSVASDTTERPLGQSLEEYYRGILNNHKFEVRDLQSEESIFDGAAPSGIAPISIYHANTVEPDGETTDSIEVDTEIEDKIGKRVYKQRVSVQFETIANIKVSLSKAIERYMGKSRGAETTRWFEKNIYDKLESREQIAYTSLLQNRDPIIVAVNRIKDTSIGSKGQADAIVESLKKLIQSDRNIPPEVKKDFKNQTTLLLNLVRHLLDTTTPSRNYLFNILKAHLNIPDDTPVSPPQPQRTSVEQTPRQDTIGYALRKSLTGTKADTMKSAFETAQNAPVLNKIQQQSQFPLSRTQKIRSTTAAAAAAGPSDLSRRIFGSPEPAVPPTQVVESNVSTPIEAASSASAPSILSSIKKTIFGSPSPKKQKSSGIDSNFSQSSQSSFGELTFEEIEEEERKAEEEERKAKKRLEKLARAKENKAASIMLELNNEKSGGRKTRKIRR